MAAAAAENDIAAALFVSGHVTGHTTERAQKSARSGEGVLQYLGKIGTFP